MDKRITILVVVICLVNGAYAQGFLGRLKQDAVDAAKSTVNQTVPVEGTQTKEQANADQSKKQWEEDQVRIKKMKADQEAEQARMNARWKEDKAKRDADATEREQRMKEMSAQTDKKVKEREAQEKNEARNEIFEELRMGKIKTADGAKQRFETAHLWQDGMEGKIKEVIAERMSKAAQNKFPVSDTFKTPVKVYKEFESGMSLGWCRAKLETDGSDLYTYDDTIVLKTDDSKVTLIFKKLTPETPPVLTACVVELPSSIRYSQVLEKYKREIPNATVKRDEVPTKLPSQENYVKDGISLDMQFSKIQVTDTLTSPAQTVKIESRLLVGKAYLIYLNDNRRVLVCESSKDGTVTVPNGLDKRQQEAAAVVKDQMLAETQRTIVVIEDKAMAQALKDMQQVEQKDEKNKQQQKNAKTLDF